MNPATGEPLREVPCAAPADAEAAVARARAAQPAWAALPFRERASAMRRLARAVRDSPTFLETLVSESGKPLYEAELMELLYTLELTRYYTGRAGRRALADELRHPFIFPNKRTRVVRHPVGVVAVIGPWNWPLLNNFADCVAPLVAGNAVVLKPSEHTPLTSLAVADLWRELSLPEGVFQVLTGRGDVGQALCAATDMTFFTGSAAVGKQIARQCGERLVPAVLELAAAVWSGFAHSGQVCIRTERVFCEEAVAERFVSLCAEEMGRLRQGAALMDAAAAVDVGAITFQPQVERAERHIADAVARGARVVAGGGRRGDLPGRFFAPTLLADVTADMAVMREETFGPVLPVMRVPDAETALRLANDSQMGLSGSVWSRDVARARALARRLQAGSVCVNDALVNYFCFESPLGGVKSSGMGFRHGPEGLRQFCRIETVVENHPLLGWLTPTVDAQLAFPYKSRTQRLLRKFMKIFY
jgi:acyl-CoA reductase-like NAD-dependent aldehyde dehydrogenase